MESWPSCFPGMWGRDISKNRRRGREGLWRQTRAHLSLYGWQYTEHPFTSCAILVTWPTFSEGQYYCLKPNGLDKMASKVPSSPDALRCCNQINPASRASWLPGQRRWLLCGEGGSHKWSQAPGVQCHLQSPGRLVFTCTLHGVESSAALVPASLVTPVTHWLNDSATKGNVICCQPFQE